MGKFDNVIPIDITTVFNVFSFLSVSRRFLEGFDDQGRDRGYSLDLGLSLQSVSL